MYTAMTYLREAGLKRMLKDGKERDCVFLFKNKTQYLWLRLYWLWFRCSKCSAHSLFTECSLLTIGVLYTCFLGALWVLSECWQLNDGSLTAHWLLNDCSMTAELERWIFRDLISTLCRTDRQTDRHTKWLLGLLSEPKSNLLYCKL